MNATFFARTGVRTPFILFRFFPVICDFGPETSSLDTASTAIQLQDWWQFPLEPKYLRKFSRFAGGQRSLSIDWANLRLRLPPHRPQSPRSSAKFPRRRFRRQRSTVRELRGGVQISDPPWRRASQFRRFRRSATANIAASAACKRGAPSHSVGRVGRMLCAELRWRARLRTPIGGRHLSPKRRAGSNAWGDHLAVLHQLATNASRFS